MNKMKIAAQETHNNKFWVKDEQNSSYYNTSERERGERKRGRRKRIGKLSSTTFCQGCTHELSRTYLGSQPQLMNVVK